MATTLICYARLTQCSKPVKNRKKPVFLIYSFRFLDRFEWLSAEATFRKTAYTSYIGEHGYCSSDIILNKIRTELN